MRAEEETHTHTHTHIHTGGNVGAAVTSDTEELSWGRETGRQTRAATCASPDKVHCPALGFEG